MGEEQYSATIGWCSGDGVVACRKYYMFETQNIWILLGENSREYATK